MSRAINWLTQRPTKGRAFAIHLTLSLLAFLSLVAIMALYWFPGKLFFIDGGWQGLKLVAMVDLVLGPTMTLILFKPGKPKLMLDMSIIATLQIAAFSYGFYTTYQQRAVAIVYAEKGFNTVSAQDKREADELLRTLDETPQSVPSATLLKLPILITPKPDAGEFSDYLEDLFNGYPEAMNRSDQYVAIAGHQDSMREDALDAQHLRESGVMEAVEHSLSKHGLSREDVEFYRFRARYADGIALFDPEHLRIVDYIPHNAPTSTTSIVAEESGSGEY